MLWGLSKSCMCMQQLVGSGSMPPRNNFEIRCSEIAPEVIQFGPKQH